MLAEDIQELVTKAFVLEALTDKQGCTSRYKDLPGKPLQDFVMAGINGGRYFSLLAEDLEKDNTADIFAHNLSALKASNAHKSSKYINFGLLEIMFPTVAARLRTDDPERVVAEIVQVIKDSTPVDANCLLETRRLAWSTSETEQRSGFKYNDYMGQESVWDFYISLNKDSKPETSEFQWTEQFKLGLPILEAFLKAYYDSGEIMDTTTRTFGIQQKANPQVAVGIIADMCAAAIFLWLSFNDRPV